MTSLSIDVSVFRDKISVFRRKEGQRFEQLLIEGDETE